MALEDEIKQRYHERGGRDALYNSVYSSAAGEERRQKMKRILSPLVSAEKTILEIGAGQGHNVPILRDCGFADSKIFLNELLPDRIAAIKRDLPAVGLYPGDALRIEFGRQFDFIFQSTVFTSILAGYDREALAAGMWKLLKPGGHIIWYDFIYNNPRNPNVRKVTMQEIRSLFPNAKLVHKEKITLAPPVGRRVGKFYSFFNLPFLRSHLLVLLRKP